MPRRCAFGCPYDSKTSYHRWPNPEKNLERFKEWVRLVGGKLETDSDYEHYSSLLVCDIHFTAHHRTRYNRLSATAIPLLYLCGSYASLYRSLSTMELKL